jgi:hypothetical protein
VTATAREQPMPDVQVRIAVAVDVTGEWYAIGANIYSDKQAAFEARNGWGGPNKVVTWLTATLQVPEAVEVQANVEEDQ